MCENMSNEKFLGMSCASIPRSLSRSVGRSADFHFWIFQTKINMGGCAAVAAAPLISFYFVIWKLFMNVTDDTAFIVGHCAGDDADWLGGQCLLSHKMCVYNDLMMRDGGNGSGRCHRHRQLQHSESENTPTNDHHEKKYLDRPFSHSINFDESY